MNEINQFLNNKDFNENKVNISKTMINFIPDLESNDTNDNIIKKHNDIRDIYSKIDKITLNTIKLKTQVNSIWESIDKYIMIYLQKELDNKKNISIDNNNENNEYINILNKYQEYFDFEKYNIIPNSYGKFLNINELEDYNDIPEDILKGIKRIFLEDLKIKSIYQGIKIKGIKNISLHDIGEIIEKCFENKKNEEQRHYCRYKYDYRYTYDICKIIIKYIPLKGKKKDDQLRLYYLYKLFDKEIEEPIDINSYENLYTDVNKGIIQYINEKINDCNNVKNAEKYTNDIFKLINENSDIFEPNEYKIIPNQLGELKKIDELYKDNDIFEELKNILSEKYDDVKEKLMAKRIIKFSPNKIMNNEELKNKINDLIKDDKLDIKKTLELIPKNDDGNKQKDIKAIYEILCNDGKQLKEIVIDLESTFWNITNEFAKKKIINSFKKKTQLKDIDQNEDKALRILETLYKYIQPELKDNENLKIVPNQYGNLLGYNELSEEKQLNQNFKNMMKKLFDYDISFYLKHKNLNYSISKILTINEDIIQKINEGFKNDYDNIKEKAKEFIKFYPKNEEDNYVFKFIDTYKALTGEKFNEEQINTNNIIVWEKAIKILLEELLNIINNDKNIEETSKRIKLDEDKTIEKLNIYLFILIYPFYVFFKILIIK